MPDNIDNKTGARPKKGKLHEKLKGKAAGLDTFLSLKPVDQQILLNYISKDSPTYNNGTQSVLAVKPNYQYGSAAMKVSDMLKKPETKESTLEIMQKTGIGIDVRMAKLAEIITGDSKAIVDTEYIGDNGEIKSRIRVTKGTTPTESLKAIDIANKIDGTYSKAELAKEAASIEMRQMYKRFMPELKSTVKQYRHDAKTGPNRAKTGNGEGGKRVQGAS